MAKEIDDAQGDSKSDTNNNDLASDSPKKLGGTTEQIEFALKFYTIFSTLTGIMLIILCVEVVCKYIFHVELFLNPILLDGSSPFLAFVHEDAVKPGTGTNLFSFVPGIHGWCYIIYLVASFNLWSRMRWKFSRLLLFALGGGVPFLSFIMESRVNKEVKAELSKMQKS